MTLEQRQELMMEHLLAGRVEEANALLHGLDYDEYLVMIRWMTRTIQEQRKQRDGYIVAADQVPGANRRMIAKAAGWPPSTLYRMLKRYGRSVHSRSKWEDIGG